MRLASYVGLSVVSFVGGMTGWRIIALISSAIGSADARPKTASLPIPTGIPEIVAMAAPYGAVAVLGMTIQARTGGRGGPALFGTATSILVVGYCLGFDAAEQALRARAWTAAALTIGLIPYAIGLPVVILATAAGAVLLVRDRRSGSR